MTRRATLRWPRGEDWGYLTIRAEDGSAQFAGFVRMVDERVQALVEVAGTDAPRGDMCEVQFSLDERTPLVVSDVRSGSQ
jgi:hypothetical protein